MSETRSSPKFDSQKAETFAVRLLNALNSGGFCLMASIGHRTGLFDAMREQPPMTSGEIAARAISSCKPFQAVVSVSTFEVLKHQATQENPGAGKQRSGDKRG